MKTVPRSPSRDVGMPHSVSCSPAWILCTGESPREPQRPPAKEAGKDWERMREGAWAGKANSGDEGLEYEDMGRLGEVVVIGVRWPAEPMQQEVKGFRRRGETKKVQLKSDEMLIIICPWSAHIKYQSQLPHWKMESEAERWSAALHRCRRWPGSDQMVDGPGCEL